MKRHGFTILELLLVLGLSAMMLTIAVPAFYRTMRGSATGSAARELMGKINAARAYAASNRTDVAIVFPRNETSDVSNALKYRAYRVCEVDISGRDFAFRRWVPGENWNYLPAGAVIGRNSSGDTRFGATDQTSTATGIDFEVKDVPIKLNDTTKTADIGNVIVIRMDGMLHKLQPVLIRLKQGTVSGGTVTFTPPNQGDYLPVTVLFNGKVKLYRELVSE